MNQTNQILSLLTSAFKIHMNIGQELTINTSDVFMSLERCSLKSLTNKTIQHQIHFPSSFNSSITLNSIILLRVRFL
jgi:hypothetical protein